MEGRAEKVRTALCRQQLSPVKKLQPFNAPSGKRLRVHEWRKGVAGLIEPNGENQQHRHKESAEIVEPDEAAPSAIGPVRIRIGKYGTPEEVITESLLEEVFRVHTSVKIHPITKKTQVTFLSSIS